MIRTVIQQKESYTITIPKKWAQKNNIKNKSPIEITENEYNNELHIKTLQNTTNKAKEITIDVKNLDQTDIKIILNQAYRTGHDIIKLNNIQETKKEEVKNLVSTMIGFSSSQKKEKIIFETLTQDIYDQKKILNIIRKLFFIISETQKASKKELDELKKDMDTHTNYIRRIIIKYEFEGKLSYNYFTLINKLALAQHAIYRFKKFENEKIPKNILKEINTLFETLEEGFFKKELQTISQIDNMKKNIEEKLDKEIEKKHTKKIKYLYEYIRNIETCTPAMKGILLSEN